MTLAERLDARPGHSFKRLFLPVPDCSRLTFNRLIVLRQGVSIPRLSMAVFGMICRDAFSPRSELFGLMTIMLVVLQGICKTVGPNQSPCLDQLHPLLRHSTLNCLYRGCQSLWP